MAAVVAQVFLRIHASHTNRHRRCSHLLKCQEVISLVRVRAYVRTRDVRVRSQAFCRVCVY